MSFLDHDQSICKYYNPYFQTDCLLESQCRYRHLKSDQFIRYCTKLNKSDHGPLSTSERGKLNTAIERIRNRQYGKALHILRQLSKTRPVCATVAHRLAQCYEHTTKTQFAGVQYRRAISINPNVSTFHTDYALFLWTQLNDTKDAQHHFILSLKLKDDHVTHREYASLLNHEFNACDKAQYHYKQAIQLSPDDHALSHFHLGVLLCKSKDLVKGIQHLQRACDLEPNNAGFEDAFRKWNQALNDVDAYVEHKEDIIEHDHDIIDTGYSVMEFNRFIEEKVISGAISDTYIEKFEELQVNDLRFLEFMNEEYLINNIKMNVLHSRLCMKQIEKFIQNCKELDEWLTSIDVYHEYSDLLRASGILTFEAFYKYIHTAHDITNIIGKWNTDDATYIFENTPKHYRHIAGNEKTVLLL